MLRRQETEKGRDKPARATGDAATADLALLYSLLTKDSCSLRKLLLIPTLVNKQ